MALKEGASQLIRSIVTATLGGEKKMNEAMCQRRAERLIDAFYTGVRLSDTRKTADEITEADCYSPLNFRGQFEKALTQRSIKHAPDNKLPVYW